MLKYYIIQRLGSYDVFTGPMSQESVCPMQLCTIPPGTIRRFNRHKWKNNFAKCTFYRHSTNEQSNSRQTYVWGTTLHDTLEAYELLFLNLHFIQNNIILKWWSSTFLKRVDTSGIHCRVLEYRTVFSEKTFTLNRLFLLWLLLLLLLLLFTSVSLIVWKQRSVFVMLLICRNWF